MPFAVGKTVFRSPITTRHPGDEIDVREKESVLVSTLRRTVEMQRQELITLKHKVTDLGGQNEDLRKGLTISPQELATWKNQTAHVTTLQSQLDQLALWLRMNKGAEIARGEHNGWELIPLIIKYLGGQAPSPLPPETVGRTN